MSNVIKKILVATDGSDAAQTALTLAIRLAREHNAELLICNDVDYVAVAAETSAAFGVDIAGTFESLDEGAKEVLSSAVARARSEGVKACGYKLDGRAASAIVSFSVDEKVDAIVVGTRGLGGLPHLLLGSTAEGVLRMATVPVFVVHSGCVISDFDTIFVAVDDSDPSDAAAAFATELAGYRKGKLVLESVIDSDALHEQAARYGGYVSAVHEAWERDGKQLLNAIARRTEGSGVDKVEEHVVFGNPVEEIIKGATRGRANLIAIGTHGRRGLRRLAMGSVAESVIRRSNVPVVAVRSFAELRDGRSPSTDGTTRAELVIA